MVLAPVVSPNWQDPPWDDPATDPGRNILTISRLTNLRGRGTHKVEDPALVSFFTSMMQDIVEKLDDAQKVKINLEQTTSERELKEVHVTINQCQVCCWQPYPQPVLSPTTLTHCFVVLRPLSGRQIRLQAIYNMR